MSFQNRSEFNTAASSEKLTLAWLEGVERRHVWTLDSGAIYKRSVVHFVIGVAQGLTQLTSVASQGAVVEGSFFYDSTANELFIWTNGSTNPQTAEEMIVKYRFFFGNGPVAASWDLTDASEHVHYEGRIEFSPQYKHKIGISQDLVSLVGNGTLRLSNNDGALDEIFDTIIFENKEVTIYSWNRDLNFSDAKVIFRGFVTNKVYKNDTVSFKVKDQLFAMEQQVPQTVYDDTDNVNDGIKGRSKRWVYGRVDDMLLQSIDQIGEGYLITGTAETTTAQKETTRLDNFPAASTFPSSGTGAYFKINDARDNNLYVYWYDVDNGNTEPALGDTFTYREINVDAGDVSSLVQVATSDALAGDFKIIFSPFGHFLAEANDFGITTNATAETSGVTISTTTEGSNPERVTGTGTSFLADCSPGDTITFGIQEFNILQIISDTVLDLDNEPRFSFSGSTILLTPDIPTVVKNRDFFVSDHAGAELTKTVSNVIQLNRVELSDTIGIRTGDFLEFTTGERIEVKNVAPGNIVVLRQNLILIPAVSSTVTRQPIQTVFVEGKDVQTDNYTITNTAAELKITLASNTEFELAPTKNFVFSATFTNGTRSITTTDDVDLTQILEPRDYIRPQDVLFTTFYEILEVKEQEILIRTNFTDPTHTGLAEGKLPNYVGDDTIITGNVLGRTDDGTPSGNWLVTASDCMRDLVREAGLTEVNETSFTDGSASVPHLISLTLPLEPTGKSTTIKTTIDLLARSSFSAATLDNDLKIKYNVLEISIPDDFTEIDDSDVYDWEIETTNGKNIKSTILRYRHRDADRVTQEPASNLVTYDSDFVEKYIGTNKSEELDIYLYEQSSATVMANRLSYWNSLSRADMKVTSDLRLEDIEIGDTLVVNFARLYKRFGDSSSRKKALTVIGKTVNGERIVLELSDLGNLFNRSSIITPNTAPDFAAATEDEKLKYGYITEANGIINDDEDTANIHLIS